ncbi:MAG: hypothetical protein GY751_12880, partial [Bacteroidetes bacterium]|nr:hypothetical protein [Bacteroidota bacterium]
MTIPPIAMALLMLILISDKFISDNFGRLSKWLGDNSFADAFFHTRNVYNVAGLNLADVCDR